MYIYTRAALRSKEVCSRCNGRGGFGAEGSVIGGSGSSQKPGDNDGRVAVAGRVVELQKEREGERGSESE